jgi:transposase
MAKPQRRFTEDFQDEAVRLAESSGRPRREIAQDLGIGLSTLCHWIDRRRERRIEQPPGDGQEDVASELKGLRRENEILRQERDILCRNGAHRAKRATDFFAKEGSR